ncbi:hypothetical protein HNY73_017637 [Argiope bruennichi]|uniref:Uncharacterized protein n=1 Tax=Argiope bruennichi TaxID=94029 RepID=A0A8T0EAM5_ARGBR|nr:hypothetical protein HNY73_017637 [Argiope bruennichi]
MHSVCNVSTRIRTLNQIQRVKWMQGNHASFLPKEISRSTGFSSFRILCSDARLQAAVSHTLHPELSKESDHESFYLPISCMKPLDHYYLKQESLPLDIHSIEELIRTKEFKNLLARSSFDYNVNLAEHSQNYLLSSGIYFYSIENIYGNSSNCLKSKDTVKKVDEVFSGTSSDVQKNDTGKPTEEQLLVIIDKLTYCLVNFFKEPQDYSIYHKNIVFQNNIRGVIIKGLPAYIQTMYILKIYGYLQYAKVKVEILKITHHIEDGTVRVRWRVKGVSRHRLILNLWKLQTTSWQEFLNDEADWLDGFSVFNVGPDGLIYKHMCDKVGNMPGIHEIGNFDKDVTIK